MKRMLPVLAEILEQERPGATYILSFDVASCHLDISVLKAMRRLRLRPVIIPAKTTWLLQPLDAYVFRVF